MILFQNSVFYRISQKFYFELLDCYYLLKNKFAEVYCLISGVPQIIKYVGFYLISKECFIFFTNA